MGIYQGLSEYKPNAQDVTMNSKSVVRHDAGFFLKFFVV